MAKEAEDKVKEADNQVGEGEAIQEVAVKELKHDLEGTAKLDGVTAANNLVEAQEHEHEQEHEQDQKPAAAKGTEVKDTAEAATKKALEGLEDEVNKETAKKEAVAATKQALESLEGSLNEKKETKEVSPVAAAAAVASPATTDFASRQQKEQQKNAKGAAVEDNEKGTASLAKGPSTTATNIAATAEQLANWADEVSPMPGAPAPREASVPGAFAVLTLNNSRSTAAATSPETAPASGDVEEGRLANDAPVAPEAPLAPFTARLSPDESESRSTSSPNNGTTYHAPLVDAEPVKEGDAEREDKARKCRAMKIWAGFATLVLVIVLLVLGIAGVFSPNDSNDSTTQEGTSLQGTSTANHQMSLLESIRERGHLTCAFNDVPFMMSRNDETGVVGGVNSVWCKAIAAAIWGDMDGILEAEDPNTVVQKRIKYYDYVRYEDENFIERDVHAVSFTHTMQRETVKSIWRAFSAPYYYDGARVGGEPFYVKCAVEKDFRHVEECAGIRMCVMDESTPLLFALTKMPERFINAYRTPVDAIEHFANGTCNVLFMESIGVAEGTVRHFGYKGEEYAKGDSVYTKDPIAVVTPQNDTRFSDFVDAIVQATLVAEQHNISRSTADLFPQTSVFGENYQNMFRNVIRVIGNYGDIYREHLESSFPREAVNQLNNGSTGLMYAHPFGHLGQTLSDGDDEDEYDTFGPSMQKVLDRGTLLCGVREGRPGFVELRSDGNTTGLDIDFCRAIAASLFGGDYEALELVELIDQEDGFRMLADGRVDLVAGATWNLANAVNEPSTGLGFDFSQPYFYGHSESEDNFCFATREDDHDWATFVYWLVASTIYAEEREWSSSESNKMPEVLIYGVEHRRMFRNVILAVGNYGDMYSRNVEAIFPRAGRNQLNKGPIPGPQHYPMPGLM